MADFLIAYEITDKKYEGGWVKDPDDRGGETYGGVPRNFWPNWIGWHIIDMYKKLPGFPGNLKASNELEKAKKEFYEENYWKVIRGDKINNQTEANKIYDSAVNMGTGTAVILAKRDLGVIESSHMDDEFLNLLNHRA